MTGSSSAGGSAVTAALRLLRALMRSVAVLFLVSFVTFCLMFGNGTGIARGVLGVEATDGAVQQKAHELGLDRPLLVQFGDWLVHALQGDLGASYFTGQTVTSSLAVRVPVTLSLIILTFLVTTVVSVALGVGAAYYGGWVDRVLQFIAGLGVAVPGFIIAVVLVFAFGVTIPIFPATGYIPAGTSIGGWLSSLTLPVVALLIGSVATAAAQIRGTVIDTLAKDYVRTLRARGMSERAIVLRHVLRNASGPGLTVLGLQLLGLLGGAIFIEQVFALPGIGQLANSAAQAGDVDVVMGTVVVAIIIVLIVNFLTDLAQTFLNPKARTR